MKPKQTIEQGTTQTITIAPNQIELGKMLVMNGQEILDRISKELDSNPALEKSIDDDEKQLNKTEDGETYSETAEELQDKDYGDKDQAPIYNGNNRGPDDEYYAPQAIEEDSIQDYLMNQMRERDISEEEEQIAQYIIWNLDDDGYLRRSVHAIADDITFNAGIEVEAAQVEHVLQMVRELDPPGIAASDLRDCILLQLDRLDKTPTQQIAYEMIDKHYKAFSMKHHDKICTAMDIDNDRLDQALKLIKTLNPKPGSAYNGSVSEMLSQQITPDFEIEIDDSDLENPQLRLTLYNNIPELQISESYSTAYSTIKKGTKSPQLTIIKKGYEKARSFITLLKHRQEKLFKTMRAIMEYQRAFMLSGDERDLRPMGLKHIEQATGFDVSTISRITSSKYVLTPWGTFKLRHFFSEGMTTDEGDEVSTREINSVLKELVDGENKRHPLSDEKLCAMLNERGYKVARRTIAKYRENLKIPVARLRKQTL